MIPGKPQLINEYNKSLITSIISEKGPISKPQLADITKLSLPTVNKIVDQLVENQILTTSTVTSHGVGRKAKMYIINEESAYVIVLYFLNDHFIISEYNIIGVQKKTEKIFINNTSLEGSLQDIFSVLDVYVTEQKNKIKMIGLGIPGVVNEEGMVTSIPLIPGWESKNIGQYIENRYGIKTIVENDVKTMTLGFYSKYLSKQYKNIVFIYAGSGLGSGIIINKKLYKGFSNFAGEYGYMQWNEKINYETMSKELIKKIGMDSTEAITEYKKLLSRTIISFITVLNPEVIVLKGLLIDYDIVNSIKLYVEKIIPQSCMPKFILDNEKDDGEFGTMQMCVSEIMSKIKITKQSRYV